MQQMMKHYPRTLAELESRFSSLGSVPGISIPPPLADGM